MFDLNVLITVTV